MSDGYVGADELRERLAGGAAPTVIDVRSGEEYAAGHVPGALHIPLAELPRRLTEVPRDRSVVAY